MSGLRIFANEAEWEEEKKPAGRVSMEEETDGASEGRRIWKGRSVGRERGVSRTGSGFDGALEDPEGAGFDFEGLILIRDLFDTTRGGGSGRVGDGRGGDKLKFLGGVAEM